MNLSKNKIKYFSSFSQKKVRDANRLFVAEGTKLVLDLIPYFKLNSIVASQEWIDNHSVDLKGVETFIVDDEDDMRRISQLTTPSDVFALFEYRLDDSIDMLRKEKQLILALDSVQNPGNLGTIIRIADWFGIEHILCSNGTADMYNPKVVQATMGAMGRVTLHYCNLPDVLCGLIRDGYPVFGTFLNGSNIYETELYSYGIIVMGNEGSGVSKEIENVVSQRLLIPNFPVGRETSESLNVAIATGIICSEFRRREI